MTREEGTATSTRDTIPREGETRNEKSGKEKRQRTKYPSAQSFIFKKGAAGIVRVFEEKKVVYWGAASVAWGQKETWEVDSEET